MRHHLALDELVVSNLYKVWDAPVVIARAFEHVKVVMKAALAVC